MNAEDLKRAMHKVDLMLRPYMLTVNPSEEDKFKQILKDTEYENMVIVQPDNAVEMGKAFLIDRKKLEDSALPRIDFEKGDELENITFTESFYEWDKLSREEREHYLYVKPR